MTSTRDPYGALGATHAELVANILDCYGRSDAKVRQDGASWYGRARAVAASIDPTAVDRAAGVIAALSPQTSWEHNVRLARRTYAIGQASGHTRLFCGRANAIYRDGVAPLSVLGGRKVRAFYTLISDPTDRTTVCVDRHAVAVAVGRTLSDRERKILERAGVYDAVSDAYRAAAEALGIPAHAVQATTWLQWRYETAAGWAQRDALI